MTTLSSTAQRILSEEESLLTRAVAKLAEAPRRSAEGRDAGALWGQLRELRDEAAGASERDLPSLFQQMYSVRSLAESAGPRPLPDAESPYFAHLRIRDARGPRDYLLGRATFVDTTAGVRIVDWRYAPVARIFYRYQVGDTFEEEFPGGLVEGTVELRRIVVVESGRLTRIVDGRTVLVRDGERWRESGAATLGGGAGTAARPGVLGLGRDTSRRGGRADITSLLDGEQFEALSTDPQQPLLVLGSAGSGKTTVALHRLAKLAFDAPQTFPESRMRVVVPEPGLARLSRRLLAPLGLGRLRVDTLDEWLEREGNEAFGGGRLRLSDETPALVTRLKRHPALREALLRRLGSLSNQPARYPRLRRLLAESLTDRDFLRGVVERSRSDLPEAAVEAVVRHARAQLALSAAEALDGVDDERLQTLDGRGLSEETPDALAGTVDIDDVALLLFLRGRAGDHVPVDLAHLVVDEAEDLSLFELEVLARHLGTPRSCTLAGDEMQQTDSSFAGWPTMLATLGAPEAPVVRLQVSYRCPRPVALFASRLLGRDGSEVTAARAGAPVGRHAFPDEAQAQLFLANALRDLLDREPEASVGVVCAGPESATATYAALESLSQTRLVLDGEFTFEPGVDVTDIDNAKGLEWDYVVVPDAGAARYPSTDESRRRLHVAATRASHQLWVIATGRPSAILPAEDAADGEAVDGGDATTPRAAGAGA